MSLLVYRVKKFSNTAENIQYKAICEILRAEYSNKKELCLFVSNYNIINEFDGIIFKNDAVVSVEFKNYGGNLTVCENGDWTLADGTIVKGGTRNNPFEQARINKSCLKKGLIEKGVLPENQVKHVPALIVFNQPIDRLNNKLTNRTKCWLHVTDNKHFFQELEDITVSSTDLSNDDLIRLVDRLELQDEWLDKDYSDLSAVEDQNYYDNPKFAKDDFVAENGESYSLTIDTDYGKTAPLNLVHKYIKVVDDEICGTSFNPEDNVKHLLGAVRLMLKSLANDNPVIELLNVYCILMLGEYKSNKDALSLLEHSYENAYSALWDKFDNKHDFYEYISNVKKDMYDHGADRSYAEEMELIELNLEVNRYCAMIGKLNWKI